MSLTPWRDVLRKNAANVDYSTCTFATTFSRAKVVDNCGHLPHESIFLFSFKQLLQREYEGLIIDTEDGYNVSLLYDLDNLPEDVAAFAAKGALLKRNCFASVFEKYFDFQEKEISGQERAVIKYRDDETM